MASKIREEKEAVVSQIKEKLGAAQVAILTDYRGLTVAEMNELRKKCRENNVEFRVVKNTLTWLAAKSLGLEELQDYLKGPTAIAFGLEDPVIPAKIISEFSKDHDDLEIKGGILEGKVIPIEKIKELAELPPKDQLLAKLAGAMNSPMAMLLNVLNAPIRDFVYALEALRKKKEAEAS
ncbi:MAG TPA: 50S ribosomal protein L10 [Peptococcaceae bacterium]|nr:MAG: 50S ribosomal protein L10 [Clostridia bacterium 41_269]HBT20978.1 50S ribosomal protein L10 [Peptococcaceae bacterium]